MQLQRLIGAILSASALFSLAAAGDAVEAEVIASAEFPESNAFGHVVNGEKNSMTVIVQNKSDKNVTLDNIAASLLIPETDKLVKNLTALKLGIPLVQNVTLRIPYTFYSEFKVSQPGDLRLNVWLEHTTDDTKHRVSAYDSVVQVIEPQMSIFDMKLLTTYLIVLGVIGGLGYYTYLTLLPQPKKRSKPATSISAPVGTVTASGAGGYQEEWIPEHHLKKNKLTKRQGGAVSGTSGDELSPSETSGTEGRRRKGKK
ncbi:hypothetical protein AMATHDRAFT_45742 [Amanita thiersii Skay4041]|uniref:Translocon-associated protein subunit alpha n=1 Tax=Amanita thiersii Skay4041 TaxID=703135 RepID=A0A2A9NUR8_9AGAR|nr:hypothetical protein AMATHDRAFT_45742 [Amanita thiersii Skay4041]